MIKMIKTYEERRDDKEIKVTLIGDAFLDDDGNYSAYAELSKNDIENTEGTSSEYPAYYAKVCWRTFDDWDGEDGGDACNWDKPEGIKFGNGSNWIADGLVGVNSFDGYIFEIDLV